MTVIRIYDADLDRHGFLKTPPAGGLAETEGRSFLEMVL